MPDVLFLAPLREFFAKLGSSVGPNADWLSMFQEPVLENCSNCLGVELLQWSNQGPARISVGENEMLLPVLFAEVDADRFEGAGCGCVDLRLQCLRRQVERALLARGNHQLDVVGHAWPEVKLSSVHQGLGLARVLNV